MQVKQHEYSQMIMASAISVTGILMHTWLYQINKVRNITHIIIIIIIIIITAVYLKAHLMLLYEIVPDQTISS